MLDKTILFGYAVINDSFTVNRILEENNKEAVSNNDKEIFACYIENDAFAGMNGLVNERPYIVFNKKFVYTKLE